MSADKSKGKGERDVSLTCKACQVVHLVLSAAVLPLCNVGEPRGRLFDKVFLDVECGRVKHLLGYGVGLARPEPLLQEVLVERVAQCPH